MTSGGEDDAGADVADREDQSDHEKFPGKIRRFINTWPQRSYEERTRKNMNSQSDGNRGTSVADILNLLRDGRCSIDLGAMEYHRIGRMSEPESGTIAAAETDFVPSADARIIDIVWNETRANVSALCRIDGYVNLPEDAPENLPRQFGTYVFRNYAVIRDGELNLKSLPVRLGRETYDALRGKQIVTSAFADGNVYDIALTGLPLIDDGVVAAADVRDYFRKFYRLLQLKAANKVYSALLDERVDRAARRSAGLDASFGEESARYLASLGITDGGFSPKTAPAPCTGRYDCMEMRTSLRGFSSLPSFNAFRKKLDESRRLNGADELLLAVYQECMRMKDSLDASESERGWTAWLTERLESARLQIRNLTLALAKMRLAAFIGRRWFHELQTESDISMALSIDDREMQCEIALKRIEVAI